MPLQTTSAVVIRQRPLGEHDKLVSFYTADAGKVKAVARSARRPRNRFAGTLDLLNYGELVYFERPHKDLQYVNSFDVYEIYSALKQDLVGIAHGFYIAELMDQVTPERDADPELFELFLSILRTLETTPTATFWIRAFEMKLLSLAGVAPQLDVCVRCSAELVGEHICINPLLGGVVCRDCDSRRMHVRGSVSVLRETGTSRQHHSAVCSVGRGTGRLVQQPQRPHARELAKFRLSPLSARELECALGSIILYHLERPLKTLDFLETVKVGYS